MRKLHCLTRGNLSLTDINFCLGRNQGLGSPLLRRVQTDEGGY
ncbi:unnamed protein product [Moneuplotes crassus]|uniref:Uncharacterized protein n=1 Tax=Euplotes crassus TaxID=5936 RepID=A0AAD1XRQ2_EUPCR|nr:unnamed protein product [Moneuplotes crassus]